MKIRYLTTLCASVSLSIASASAAGRPNILFVFSDDHAPHAIGAYDGWLKSVNPTPNIDKLAAEGMLFENSFCTNSICGPSRAVILTGKHSHLNGFMRNGNSLRLEPADLPQAPAEGRLPDRHVRQVAPQGESRRATTTGRCCRARAMYYNPDLHDARRPQE